jgi:hypothetical protein
MAERRMFSKTVIDSDQFLDLPTEAQALYFHLAMRADDDGLLNNARRICRASGCSEDHIGLLQQSSFIACFESGVAAILDWRTHNYIRKDRYRPSAFRKEKQLVDQMTTEGREEQVSINDEEEALLGTGLIEQDEALLNHEANTIWRNGFSKAPTTAQREYLKGELLRWRDSDLVNQAVYTAGLMGAENPVAYIDTILTDWKLHNIKCYEDWADYDLQRRGLKNG